MKGLHLGHRLRSKSQTVLLIGLVIVMAVAEQVRWFAPITKEVERLFVPTKAVGVQVTAAFAWPFKAIFAQYDQATRLRELQIQHTQALARIGELEQVEKENIDLRRLLDTTSQFQDRPFAIASITSYASPTIGIGASSGIQVGSLVFFSDTLLGVVSSVSELQAKVQLIKQASSPGIVAKTETGVQGILRADGKMLRLEEIPRTAVVPKGQRVVTVGQEGIPDGLFIGITGNSSTTSEAAPVQAVVVDQLHTFYDATVVEILR